MSAAKVSATIAGMLGQNCRQCGARKGTWCQTAAHADARSLHMIRYRDWVAVLGVRDDDVVRYVNGRAK